MDTNPIRLDPPQLSGSISVPAGRGAGAPVAAAPAARADRSEDGSRAGSTRRIGKLEAAGLVAAVVLGWQFLRPAAAEQEMPRYADHQKITAGTQIQAPVHATMSAGLTRKAAGKARNQAKLEDILPTIQGDEPALLDAAGRMPGMSLQERKRLAQALASGDADVATLRFFDTCVEDGDQVLVVLSNGLRYGPFTLTNSGIKLNVPIIRDRPPEIRILGVKDGVGGITLGCQTGGGVWYSGVLQPGQDEHLPYRP